MSALINAENVSEAWLQTLEHAHSAKGGRLVHLVTSIANPTAEVPEVREVLDAFLRDQREQAISTVAETIFPFSLYQDPGFDWHHGLAADEVAVLDDAAADLYDSYVEMLPSLLTAASANSRGTYFSRMIHWPGNEAEGVNQLALRVEWLRGLAGRNYQTNNTLDIDVAADSLDDGRMLSGVQVYAVTDKRPLGFPCLTHLDLTLYKGKLHCTAVYRHQYLVKKAYGNLLGLGALMRFLCQQTGYELGELVVHATMADSENRKETPQLLADANAALLTGVAG